MKSVNKWRLAYYPKSNFKTELIPFLLHSTCILDLDTSFSCHYLEIPQVWKKLKNWLGKPFSQVWAMRVILNEVLIVVLSKGNKILQRLDLVYSFSLTRYRCFSFSLSHTKTSQSTQNNKELSSCRNGFIWQKFLVVKHLQTIMPQRSIVVFYIHF